MRVVPCFPRLGLARLLLGGLVWVGSACQPAPGTVLWHEDFEHVAPPLSPAPPWLATELAHSGRFSSRLDPSRDVGTTWTRTWAALGRPRKVQVRAWVYLPHGRLKAAISLQVFRADNPAYPYYWKTLALQQVVKRYQQWEPVAKRFHLPKDIQATDRIRVYCWHSESLQTLYLDDLSLEDVS